MTNKENLDNKVNSNVPQESNINIDLNSTFSLNNFFYIFAVLATYFIIYFILSFFFKNSFATPEQITIMAIDIFIIFIVFAYIAFMVFSMNEEDKKNWFTYFARAFKHDFDNPMSIVYTGLVIVIIYMIVYFGNVPMVNNKLPPTLDLLIKKSWYFLLILIVINIFKFGLNIPIVDIIYDTCASLWNGIGFEKFVKSKSNDFVNEPEKNSETVLKTTGSEVFNISNNLYTYDDAKSICKAYNSRLATYNEIEDAYKKGAEWCNYGWSENQMIFFPTQKSTWQELQKNPSTKNSCGRPGINGGVSPNPNIKYGVNCYGKKPSQKDNEFLSTNVIAAQFSKSTEDVELEKKTQFWKEHQEMLQLNSYNKNKWSKY